MSVTREFEASVKSALTDLRSTYGTAELTKPDLVLLMDGWNKILGWETMWKEACWFRWRILVARQSLVPKLSEAQAAVAARRLLESNQDPIGVRMGSRRWDGKNMLLALFDEQIRSLCPHTQTVQREAYRKVTDDRGASFGISLECTTAKDVMRQFSVCGIKPQHYVKLCEAFLWTMESHNPYGLDEDVNDLQKGPKDSAFARFVAEHVARPGIKDTLALREEFSTPVFTKTLPDFWNWVKHEQEGFGELFYENLLTDYAHLLDYFARADMDSLSGHIVLAIDLMVNYPTMTGSYDTAFRKTVQHLGEKHRELGIPTDTYPAIGMNLLSTLEPFFARYVKKHKGVTVESIKKAIVDVYSVTMGFTFYPMLREEWMVHKATEFYRQVAEELSWSSTQFGKRLLEVKLEIAATGTYQHTSEEIQLGARLAWRNSVKCIGRISWNTLMVRDRRHVETPTGIIREIEKHLELATAGTNLQSVMTVFRPRKPDEPWGIRFWTDQLVRYACYTDENGNTMGDTANKHITKFLIEKRLWTPPAQRTQHDVLPLVFKMPGHDDPIVHQFEAKYVDEAPIEHPTNPKIKELGHKWASVPAINTFNMNLGGVDYGCIPFNGWFASVEIVRDLMERYQGCSEKWAEAFDIDIKSHRMWKARIAHEIDVAVLHSFDKAGYTIVDPETVGDQFMTHCRREREAGRECPAQWSWIGGLTGPTNKTWHKEMRDFRVDPQYEYCCEMFSVTGEDEVFKDSGGNISDLDEEKKEDDQPQEEEEFKVPRVLIAYGSETGTAEAAAGRLARTLRLCKPTLCSLNKVAGLEIIPQRKITHLLVLCSTFGKGKPPSIAEKFFETDLPDEILSQTQVAVLALGSTMYPDFCQAGKTLQRMLVAAGASTLKPLTTADEAVDSPGTVTGWIKLVKSLVLPEPLEAAIEARMEGGSEPLRYEVKWSITPLQESEVEPFSWPEEQSTLCVINEELLVGGDINKRSTRRIGFEVPSGSSYVTGDHLAVHPINSMRMVKRFAACFATEFRKIASSNGKSFGRVDLLNLLPGKSSSRLEELLNWQLQQPFEIDCIDNGQIYPAQTSFSAPVTLGEVLQSGVSLSITESTAVDVINVLSSVIPRDKPSMNGNEALVAFDELASLILEGGKGSEHQAAMDTFLSLYPTVVDLFEAFVPIVEGGGSGRMLPLAHVLAILPRLQPRLYSISSSSITSPSVVEISVGVVHATTDNGVHIAGVCSNYLARLQPEQDRARVSIRTSSFRGPQDIVNTPMIMVGSGTGLAPMMGFLQDKAHAQGLTSETNSNELKDDGITAVSEESKKDNEAVSTYDASVFDGDVEKAEFFLAKIGVKHTTGPPAQTENSDDPLALKNILRPWQREFLETQGIFNALELIMAKNTREKQLCSAMYKWRRDNKLKRFPKAAHPLALHIWTRACESVADNEAGTAVNCHLFFGTRSHDERLYRDKISAWEDGGVLKLHLAMSRSPDRPKMYVQDKIKQQGKLLCKLLLRDDCTYYVCGDARMADFCYEAIVDALRQHGAMSRAKATQLLKRMRVEDRWQSDVWGISAYLDDDSQGYGDSKKKAAKLKSQQALTWLNRMQNKDQEELW